jgi:hypothetical protein
MKNDNHKDWIPSIDAAMAYIRAKGYASYNSLKMVRDKTDPDDRPSNKSYFTFGTELHSRLLEQTKIETLSELEEKQLAAMLKSIRSNSVVKRLLDEAETEVEFRQKLNGVTVMGYIDILSFAVADLKTTKHKTMKPFVESMDFLQAALYLNVAKKKDFYYIGISKDLPHPVMVFNVNEYPARLKHSQEELKYLLNVVKKNL